VKIEFVAVPVTLDAAAGEDSPRSITGVAVPWDTPAAVSSGESVMFKRGAFDVNAKAPKLLEGHDMTQLRGVVTELVEAEEGLLFTAKFAKTRASDEAIELIKAGAYDSVSVGAIPVKFKYDKLPSLTKSQKKKLSNPNPKTFPRRKPCQQIPQRLRLRLKSSLPHQSSPQRVVK